MESSPLPTLYIKQGFPGFREYKADMRFCFLFSYPQRIILNIYKRFLISIPYREVRMRTAVSALPSRHCRWNRILFRFAPSAQPSLPLLVFGNLSSFPETFSQLSALSLSKILQSARCLVSRVRFLGGSCSQPAVAASCTALTPAFHAPYKSRVMIY